MEYGGVEAQKDDCTEDEEERIQFLLAAFKERLVGRSLDLFIFLILFITFITIISFH